MITFFEDQKSANDIFQRYLFFTIMNNNWNPMVINNFLFDKTNIPKPLEVDIKIPMLGTPGKVIKNGIHIRTLTRDEIDSLLQKKWIKTPNFWDTAESVSGKIDTVCPDLFRAYFVEQKPDNSTRLIVLVYVNCFSFNESGEDFVPRTVCLRYSIFALN